MLESAAGLGPNKTQKATSAAPSIDLSSGRSFMHPIVQ